MSARVLLASPFDDRGGSARARRLFAFGGIGDGILLTPSLRALAKAEPHGKIIVWSANSAHEAVFRHNPNVSSFRYINRTAHRLYHFLRGSEWMPYVDTDYSRTLPSLLCVRNAAHTLAETLGLTLNDVTPELFLTAEETARAVSRMRGVRHPTVAIHVRASSSPNKNWPLENWRQLVAAHPEISFIQLGNANEEAVPGAIIVLGIPLRQSFAVLKQCDAFVGVDSGLGHAATALQIPAVILFGATDPAVWGHAQNCNLHKRRYCSPCIDLLQDTPCPFSAACMKDISVSSVAEALQEKLHVAHGVDETLRA